jgi:PPM family protein phosphatase
MIELDIATAETLGTRAEQQDAAAIARLGSHGHAAVLVVADGLGGHADGAEAARIVVETFRERASGGAFDTPDLRHRALYATIHDVNRRILAASDPADGERGMASTAVAALIAEGCVRWISVGDSHLYVWRHGRLAKLNADHSQAGMMIREGRAADDPAVLGARSLLASALTGGEIEEIDSPARDVALAIGDVILLASDGLNTLSHAEIEHLLGETAERGADAIATALIDAVLAQNLPRQDNATVIITRVLGSGAPAGADDDLPDAVASPEPPGTGRRTGRQWPVAVGLALLAAIVAGVIMTQMP